MVHVTFTLNGEKVSVDVKPNEILLDTLRLRLGVKSVKRGCERGECGVCTVLLDGKPVYSCMILTVRVDGHEVTTIEGVAETTLFKKIVNSFLERSVVQCGYCLPGILLTAYSFWRERYSSVGTEEVVKAIEGHLCRCTGYRRIVEAVKNAFFTPPLGSSRRRVV